jgi:hypothetical protein
MLSRRCEAMGPEPSDGVPWQKQKFRIGLLTPQGLSVQSAPSSRQRVLCHFQEAGHAIDRFPPHS